MLLAACATQTATPTPIQVPVPTQQTVATLTPASQQRALQPTQPPVPPLATPAPAAPVMRVAHDPQHPIEQLGPLAPSGQWLITRQAGTDPLFGVHRLQQHAGSSTSDTQPRYVQGTAFDWSADGSLILFTTPAAPTVLAALEPTSGISATVLTSDRGPITGFVWLRSALLYATQSEALLRLVESDGTTQRIVAQLRDRTLVPGAMLIAPDDLSLALIVASTISDTVELYHFHQPTGELILLDQANIAADPARIGAVWSAHGKLAYDLGSGIRHYEPALNAIIPSGINGRPLTWTDQGLLIRQHESGRLLRWEPQGVIQPFGTDESPVVVADALTLNQQDLLFLINGEVWQSRLP